MAPDRIDPENRHTASRNGSQADASVVVSCTGLAKAYGSGEGRVQALDGVDLEVHAGELVILRGPSGSGKTTLLNLLGTLDRADAGTVSIGGRDVTAATETELVELRRHELGYIFQSFALLPVLSAAENVDLPMRIVGMPTAEREARVTELLAAVGLTGHENQRPDELSGGQQQRLGIARSLANHPRVLIADEPTGQLDSTNADAMMSLIARLVHETGVAALVTTHDPRMATYADRILDLRDGRIDAGRPGRHSTTAAVTPA